MIEEAAKEFYLQGYKATTMRSLASAVGIKHPSLFSLFENKSAIASVIMSKYYQGVEGSARKFVEEHPDPVNEEEAVRLVFYAMNYILLYEDRHIAEFLTSFYDEDSEAVDRVIDSLHHLETPEEIAGDEFTRTMYRLDTRFLGMISMMLTKELGEKAITPKVATQYFTEKVLPVRKSARPLTVEEARRYHTEHWEEIQEAVRKIDVYKDYFMED